MKKNDPASRIQDLRQFGEFGGVNPSVTDSSTYTFLEADTMEDTFHGEAHGCFLYSRHWNPSNKYLSDALSALEKTESSWITASGMAAITCTVLELCNAGDHIVTSVTTYGGTFAFLNNYLPRFNIEVSFVNITDLESVEKAIRPETRLIFTESLTNPMLQVSDIPALAEICKNHGIKLVVDNTFSPMIISPVQLGADVVVYSMTKFINGKNDCLAGAICSSSVFIDALSDVKRGTAMLLGPVLDPMRSSGILKNLHSLHLRMKQHSSNALFLSERFRELGLKVIYPGLKNHPGHELMKRIMNPEFGYGGMLVVELADHSTSNQLMQLMQEKDAGYLAVSLGYFKTLFSSPGYSTSSEVPQEIQQEIGLTDGLIRFSVGLDNDIERTFDRVFQCLKELKII